MFCQASEYALRSLSELVRYPEGEWVLTAQLAKPHEIPVYYLAKVLQTLARRGLLESQRGRNGGFRLSKHAGEISAYDVVLALEDVRSLERCVMGEKECSDATACPMHAMWKGFRSQFTEALKTTSLKDLAAFQNLRPNFPQVGDHRSRKVAKGPPRTQ
ncbi:MAG TPA: Rrf2 family transcriptional regulator [Planctomycetota bacterium]|nr:Rrf2 family transcriptional regulator [Planctomycetota bacterium]